MQRCRDEMDTTPPRLVLDTHVCLELLHFVDPRVQPLHAALRRGDVVAVRRADCREEWRRVLRNPQLQLDPATCARLDAGYDELLQPWPADPRRDAPALPRCADGDDQKFLELARDAGAIALLTRDAALRVLHRRALRLHGFSILPPEHFPISAG